MAGDALDRADGISVVAAKHVGARHHRDLGHRVKRGDAIIQPCRCAGSAIRPPPRQKSCSHRMTRAPGTGDARGCQSSGAGANDQDIAVRVRLDL